jgi:hypothetical protein
MFAVISISTKAEDIFFLDKQQKHKIFVMSKSHTSPHTHHDLLQEEIQEHVLLGEDPEQYTRTNLSHELCQSHPEHLSPQEYQFHVPGRPHR